jgi:hypothetical protein
MTAGLDRRDAESVNALFETLNTDFPLFRQRHGRGKP